MPSPINSNNPGGTLNTPSNDRKTEIANTIFQGYVTAYTNQILGLEVSLAGTAINTMGQIQQLQLDMLEKQIDMQNAADDKQQQDKQNQQNQQQDQKKETYQKEQQNTQNYINYLEKHVQQLERQIRQLKNSDN